MTAQKNIINHAAPVLADNRYNPYNLVPDSVRQLIFTDFFSGIDFRRFYQPQSAINQRNRILKGGEITC